MRPFTPSKNDYRHKPKETQGLRQRYPLTDLIFGPFILLCAFVSVTEAQNYYPADVGNTWVLESEDGAERVTYTIEAADEPVDGEEVRILKLTTEVLGTSTINTNTFLVQVAENGMKLHRIVAELGDVFGVARVDFSPPVIFFPETLQLGEVWETRGETEVAIVGAVTVSSVNEVVAVESVVTSAGTFKNCLKNSDAHENGCCDRDKSFHDLPVARTRPWTRQI